MEIMNKISDETIMNKIFDKILEFKGTEEDFYLPHGFSVVVNPSQARPWTFPGCIVEKDKIRLPVGDYGLSDENGIVAIAERKSFSQFASILLNLTEFYRHAKELKPYKHAAIFVEANYEDFLEGRRMKKWFSREFALDKTTDILCLLPWLHVGYAGGREAANWRARSFFWAVANITKESKGRTSD